MIKIALTIILTLFPSISMACDCASRPIEERYNESEAVFLGDVVAHESNPNHWNGSDVIQFKVIESFKGNFGNMAVKTGQSMCDYFFPDIGKPGEHFLVFLTITKEGISINRCFGTSLESSATEDLKWLRLHSKKIKNHNKKK